MRRKGRARLHRLKFCDILVNLNYPSLSAMKKSEVWNGFEDFGKFRGRNIARSTRPSVRSCMWVR